MSSIEEIRARIEKQRAEREQRVREEQAEEEALLAAAVRAEEERVRAEEEARRRAEEEKREREAEERRKEEEEKKRQGELNVARWTEIYKSLNAEVEAAEAARQRSLNAEAGPSVFKPGPNACYNCVARQSVCDRPK